MDGPQGRLLGLHLERHSSLFAAGTSRWFPVDGVTEEGHVQGGVDVDLATARSAFIGADSAHGLVDRLLVQASSVHDILLRHLVLLHEFYELGADRGNLERSVDVIVERRRRLPLPMGRSYGCSCHNHLNRLPLTSWKNKLVDFKS